MCAVKRARARRARVCVARLEADELPRKVRTTRPPPPTSYRIAGETGTDGLGWYMGGSRAAQLGEGAQRERQHCRQRPLQQNTP